MSRRRRFEFRDYVLRFSDVHVNTKAKDDRRVIDQAIAKLRAFKRSIRRNVLARVVVSRGGGELVVEIDEKERIRPPRPAQGASDGR